MKYTFSKLSIQNKNETPHLYESYIWVHPNKERPNYLLT